MRTLLPTLPATRHPNQCAAAWSGFGPSRRPLAEVVGEEAERQERQALGRRTDPTTKPAKAEAAKSIASLVVAGRVLGFSTRCARDFGDPLFE